MLGCCIHHPLRHDLESPLGYIPRGLFIIV
nr:MAG TPA: histidine kinase-like protein [Caudoviricetes sp.]